MVGGIKHIAKSLGMTEAEYRQLLSDLTGKRSTKDLDMKELNKVFSHFRQLQGQAESSR
jgi:phage gp16-like protein